MFPSLDPYSAAIKIGGKVALVALIVIALVGGYYKIQAQGAQIDLVTQERDIAIVNLTRREENAEKIIQLEEAHNVEVKKLHDMIEVFKRGGITHARPTPVKKECEEAVADFYAPFAATIEFMRSNKAERDSRIAAALTLMPPRAGSTEPRESKGSYPRGSSFNNGLLAGRVRSDGLPW